MVLEMTLVFRGFVPRNLALYCKHDLAVRGEREDVRQAPPLLGIENKPTPAVWRADVLDYSGSPTLGA